MSWDVWIIKGTFPTSQEWDNEFRPAGMGSPDEIRSLISQSLPAVQWGGNFHGSLNSHDCSIEISLIDSEIIEIIFVHVYGKGNPFPPLMKLCKGNKWTAFDTTTAEFIDTERPSDEGWRKFRRAVEQIRKVVEEKWWQVWN